MKGIRKNLVLAVAFFAPLFLLGQNSYYTAPLKIPLQMSGSFAELRTNHFHSGIDLKTQGVTGIPVYAIADGFVSRIAVSPTGYGNALYITHYNGTTSVYGHLETFRNDIQEYEKKIQYRDRSFRIDMQVSPEEFLVKKGEMVAKSGNSGSSGGPHLHFEIRDTESEEPMNPLDFGFGISDQTPPRIYALLVEPLSENAHVNLQKSKKIYSLAGSNNSYSIVNNPVIPVSGKIGFAIEANDFFDQTPNKCGINFMEMKIDGELHFSIQLNRFSFTQSRYINSYIDFAEYITTGRRFQRTWTEPGNRFGAYETSFSNGIYEIPADGKPHQIEIEIKDSYGNLALLNFWVQHQHAEIKEVTREFARRFEFNQENTFENDEIQLVVPNEALYRSFHFEFKKSPATTGYFSSLHQIHFNTVPLHKNATLRLKTENIPFDLEEKALLVNIDQKTGKFRAAGGTFENGWVSGETGSFGTYSVRLDTVPPVIKPLSISGKSTLTERNRIRFIISDDLAGINKIEGLLDGKWALFEYDAKNSLIFHTFDETRFEMNKTHQLKLTVSDYKNNVSVYEATFYR